MTVTYLMWEISYCAQFCNIYCVFFQVVLNWLKKLLQDEKLTKNNIAKAGVEDMKLLFKYCQLFGCLNNVCSIFLLIRKPMSLLKYPV